jgi:hypothetical protein
MQDAGVVDQQIDRLPPQGIDQARDTFFTGNIDAFNDLRCAAFKLA